MHLQILGHDCNHHAVLYHLATTALVCATLIAPGALAADDIGKTDNAYPSQTFGWPFADPGSMKVRGGITRGSEVELDPAISIERQELQASSLSNFERDRLAILAMAGEHRTSFQFVETAGFSPDYQPARPYFSWGTEYIEVLEDNKDFISLQHTLVMFFAPEEGAAPEPLLIKHWRQDWTYQDDDLHEYLGASTWQRSRRLPDQVKGTWTQAVYQVDDSPRYEVVGTWRHAEGISTWLSEDAPRPLPRREFSVRDDYEVLAGTHRITITPTGWLHEQHNRKLAGDIAAGDYEVIATELGVNRYERINGPDLEPTVNEYWARTGDYWAEVRDAWAEVMGEFDRFTLRASYEDQKLFIHHFGYADSIASADKYDSEEGARHARETIRNFLVVGDAATKLATVAGRN